MQLRSEVPGVRASTCEVGGQSPTRTLVFQEGMEAGGPWPRSREAQIPAWLCPDPDESLQFFVSDIC